MKKMTRIMAVVIVLAMALSLSACDSSDYKKAVASYQAGDYEAASAAFKALGEYEDSAELANDCDYQLALALYNAKNYTDAIPALEALGEYKDCADLIAKANDTLINEALVGKWASDEIDSTDLFMDGLTSSLSGDGMEILDYFELENFTIIYTLEFTDKGTIVESVDSEHFKKSVDKLADAFYDACIAYVEDSFTKAAEEEGVTYQWVLDYYEAADTAELAGMLFGMELDEFVNLLIVSPYAALAEGMAENGTFSVKDGVITLAYGTESEEGELDLASDVLTLTGEGAPDEQQDMYPMVFSRVE